MSWTASVVTDLAGLSALEPAWWDLWRSVPTATPFTSPAWIIPWYAAFAPGPLRSVALHRDGQLVALAPCFREDGPLGRRLLPLGIGLSDYMDVLVAPAFAADGSRRLVDAVAAMPDWERWELEELPPGAAALDLPRPESCLEDEGVQSPCPLLAPLDETLATVPAGQRRKVRMARHRSDRRAGRVAEHGPGEAAEFVRTVSALHRARWEMRGEPGVMADPRVERFHREAMPRLGSAGLVRATTLVIGVRAVGAYYGLQHGAAAYAYLGGFDPAFAFESPGTVLLADAMEAAARAGATCFHLLRGQEPYKYAWGAADRWNRRRSFRRSGS